MADNLTVKEISELNNVSINDSALVLAYTDADGVGKTTFKDAKNYIGCNIDIEQTENAAGSGGTNKIKATVRNGTETETKEFTYKNGNGLNSVTKTESTDTNGLKSNTVKLKSNDATLIPDVSFTVKDGVGVKSSGQTTASTLSGELNEYTITLTDGTTNTIKVYNGRAGKDFRIKKTYTSISEMESDFSNTEIETYDFAMIDTGSVDDEDTGKLYYKNTDAWTYVGDLSGAQGVKGETGNGIASIENTLTDEGKIKVTITMTDGTTTEFLINNGLEYTAGNGIAISESNVVSVSDDIKTQIGLDKVDNTADSEKSVKYATSAGSADKPTGFSSRTTTDTWGTGNKIGTEVTGWRSTNGGTVTFRENGNSTNKQLNQIIDGVYYQNEGNYKVVDENSIGSLNAGSATKLATARSISITDGTNTGTASSFDGSGNVSLSLPSTIKATADNATSLQYTSAISGAGTTYTISTFMEKLVSLGFITKNAYYNKNLKLTWAYADNGTLSTSYGDIRLAGCNILFSGRYSVDPTTTGGNDNYFDIIFMCNPSSTPLGLATTIKYTCRSGSNYSPKWVLYNSPYRTVIPTSQPSTLSNGDIWLG